MFERYFGFGRGRRGRGMGYGKGRGYGPGMGYGPGAGRGPGGGRGYGMGYGRGFGAGWYGTPGYTGGTVPDAEQIRESAQKILSSVTKGQPWPTRAGFLRIPLIYNGQPIGELFEDVDPKTLEIDGYWQGRFGTRINLVSNGRIVGYLCIPF